MPQPPEDQPGPFSPRRLVWFLRRSWLGLSAILLAVGGWVFYAALLYQPEHTEEILGPVEVLAGEQVDLRDREWFFTRGMPGGSDLAFLRYRHHLGRGNVTSLAAMDLETSRTLLMVKFTGGDIYNLDDASGEIRGFRRGRPDTWRYRLALSMGDPMSSLLKPREVTEFFRFDAATGSFTRRILPLGLSPIDMSPDGRYYTGFTTASPFQSDLWRSTIVDIETMKEEPLPALFLQAWFEDTGDLILAGKDRLYRYRRGDGTMDGPLALPAGVPDESFLAFRDRADNPRRVIASWSSREFHGSLRDYGLLEITLDGSSYVDSHRIPEALRQDKQLWANFPTNISSMEPASHQVTLFNGKPMIHWNYRTGRYIVDQRDNSADILLYINKDYVADKKGGKFRIFRLEEYFPADFLGTEDMTH